MKSLNKISILLLSILLLASCSSRKQATRPERAQYVPDKQVNLDEWTYYKPITVYYLTDNGRKWAEYHNYRVYYKKLTNGYKYVVGDVNNQKVYEFGYGGTGKYQFTFNNGKEPCYFNCKLEDVSRIVHITHQ